MRRFALGVCLLACSWQAGAARAAFEFSTDSSATQTITSPLFSTPFTFTGVGTQTFVIDPTAGTASVTSFFQGNDIPNPFAPGTFFSYNEYNTTTAGVVTPTGSGTYTITFNLLFEVDLTSGPFAGLELATTQPAIFQVANIADIPFLAGTVFGDPNRPNDGVTVYVQYDPTNTLPVGTPFGTSFDRTVTINSIVPEPSSLALCVLGAGIATIAARSRGRKRSEQTR